LCVAKDRISVMKILVCNTLEKKGGAARSARRITECLKQNGIDAQYQYLYKEEQERKSLIPKIDAIPKLLSSKQRKTPFSSSLFSFGGKKMVEKLNPDILHLNYINMGMFSIKEIGNFNIPIVWTLHDSWTFTGGCHLPNDCMKYTSKCNNCPALGSTRNFDLSTYILSQKEKHWSGKSITLVCPSEWLAKKAKESRLFRNSEVLVIPNPIDTSVFKPYDKEESRKKYNLESDKRYILFGSVNPLKDRNKGFHFLRDALKNFDLENTELLVFGTDQEGIDVDIPVRSVGYIEEEKDLAMLYSASDVTIISSMSENLPNVLIESLACGTPCVGFDVGGVPEIINKKELGEVVEPFDTRKLSEAIKVCLTSKERFSREDLHLDIEQRYGYKVIAEKYTKLYESLSL